MHTRTPIRLLAVALVVLGAALAAGPASAEDRPAPADSLTAQATAELGTSYSRPAPSANLRQAPVTATPARDANPGLSRPAPAQNVAAHGSKASSTSVAAVPVDGFDAIDALVGGAIALGLALLLAAGLLVVRGHRRPARR
jgi:hypothetical protein